MLSTISESPHEAFVAALVAVAPHPDRAERLHLFGQFVGSWDLTVTDHRPGRETSGTPGEWHFGWLLGGNAVGDVWIYPARSTGQTRVEHGASVRFPDPDGDGWRSTWIGPLAGIVRPFIARPVGDEIILAGSFSDGVETRWVFSDITDDSFAWRNEERADGESTWRLLQTFAAVRR